MGKHHFKEGDEVCHKDNIGTKLIVARVLKESLELKKGLKNGEPVIERVVRMIGIECHWWEVSDVFKEKKLMKQKFHSSELVPYEICLKGIDAVKEWLIK